MFWFWLIVAFVAGMFFAVIVMAFFIGAHRSRNGEE